MKTKSATMREMSLDGITDKVKVKAAAAAKNLVMYVLCPLSICAAVCSCSGSTDENVTVLTEKQVLDGAAEVVPDTVCVLPDTVFVARAWMMDPGHVMCRMESKDRYALTVFDVRTLEPTAEYLHYGNGPQEVKYVYLMVTDGRVYVKDYNKLYEIPCDSAGIGVRVGEYGYDLMASVLIRYGDSLLTVNPFYLESGELGISQGEPKLMFSDGKSTNVGESADKIFTVNCFQGRLLTNAVLDRIAYIERDCSLVELYDGRLNLLRAVVGPGEDRPRYFTDGRYLFYELWNAYSYVSACSDDNYIYLLYDGKMRADGYPVYKGGMESGVPTMISAAGDTDLKDMTLIALDWDGNLKGSWRIHNVNTITEISSTGIEGEVYVCVTDRGDLPLTVLRYKLF